MKLGIWGAFLTSSQYLVTIKIILNCDLHLALKASTLQLGYRGGLQWNWNGFKCYWINREIGVIVISFRSSYQLTSGVVCRMIKWKVCNLWYLCFIINEPLALWYKTWMCIYHLTMVLSHLQVWTNRTAKVCWNWKRCGSGLNTIYSANSIP